MTTCLKHAPVARHLMQTAMLANIAVRHVCTCSVRKAGRRVNIIPTLVVPVLASVKSAKRNTEPLVTTRSESKDFAPSHAMPSFGKRMFTRQWRTQTERLELKTLHGKGTTLATTQSINGLHDGLEHQCSVSIAGVHQSVNMNGQTLTILTNAKKRTGYVSARPAIGFTINNKLSQR